MAYVAKCEERKARDQELTLEEFQIIILNSPTATIKDRSWPCVTTALLHAGLTIPKQVTK